MKPRNKVIPKKLILRQPIKFIRIYIRIKSKRIYRFIAISKKRVAISVFVIALVAGAAVYGGNYLMNRPNYSLSQEENLLLTPTDTQLLSKLTYNKKSSTFQLNQSGINSQSGQSGFKVGTENNSYSADLNTNLSKGLTFYDDTSNLSFSLTPLFHTATGREENQRFVYPLAGNKNVDAVYTVKLNGLKEDILINKPTDSVSYSYKLELPNDLQARIVGGALGIYSADPVLFGNISYGSSKDQALVQKARQNSIKDHLVFELLPPTIMQSSGRRGGSLVVYANISYKNGILTVTATNLSKLKYPISVDPSVLVSSANTFGVNSNNEGDIALSPWSNQISEAGYSGGSAYSGFTDNSSTNLPFNYIDNANNLVAYNGFLYIVGGIFNASANNSVYYAALNSNGTLSANTCGTSATWCQLTSLPTPDTFDQSVVEYNGYIYAIGGCSTGAFTCTVSSTIYYAKITSSGSLSNNTCGTGSAWCTNPYNLATAVWGANAVAYDGYVYVIGGCTSSVNSIGCPVLGYTNTTVAYAKINPNGTINSSSTWSTSSGVSSPRYLGFIAAYNGYLYYGQGYGCSSSACTSLTPENDMYYASINSNGSINDWVSTNHPTNTIGRLEMGYGISDGYLYLIGGCDISSCSPAGNDVEYSPVYSNGSIGAWSSTSTLITGVMNNSGAVYNGVIYSVGGCSSSSNGSCSSGYTANYVQYAQVDPAGAIGSATTGSVTLPTAVTAASVVAANGCVVVMGGSTSTGYTTTVQVGCINSSTGAISSFSTSSVSLAQAVGDASATVYGNYIYVFGGCSASGVYVCATFSSAVQYASISASGGTLSGNGSAFYTGNSLATAEAGGGAAAYKGYLYVFGGYDSSLVPVSGITTVQVSAIGSNGVDSGFSNETNGLTEGVFDAPAVIVEGYVYVMGGATTANSNAWQFSTYIQSALINTSTHNFNSFSNQTAQLNSGCAHAGGYFYNGYLYFIGGNNGSNDSSFCSSTQTAPVNSSNGVIGSWTNTTLPYQYQNTSATGYNGYIYEAGGYNSSSSVVNEVGWAPINNGGGGGVPSVGSTQSLPYSDQMASSVAFDGYIYELGGCSAGFCATLINTVEYAKIDSNGLLDINGPCGSPWCATTSLPTATFEATSVVYDGYIYELGGCTISSTCTTTAVVDYAQIDTTNGLLDINGPCGSPWCATTSLPTATDVAATSVYNGYIYEIGGCNGYSTCALGVTTVDYAQIDTTNGLLDINGPCGSPWCATTSLPVDMTQATSVINNSVIYVLGGCASVENCSTGAYSSVYYDTVNPNGTLGSTWQTAPNLPQPTIQATSELYDGYIYEIGGCPSTGGITISCGGYNNIYVAPIYNNGDLGSWFSTSNLTLNSRLGTSVVYNGYIYQIAGVQNGSIDSVVQIAGLDSIPKVGFYSYLADMTGLSGEDVDPIDLVINGSNSSNAGISNIYGMGLGGISVSYSYTDDSCITPTTTAYLNFPTRLFQSTIPVNITNNGCGTATNQARYAWLKITLDDSQNLTWPDVYSNHDIITGFNLYYHPNPGLRLRGGATFDNQNLQALDTPPD